MTSISALNRLLAGLFSALAGVAILVAGFRQLLADTAGAQTSATVGVVLAVLALTCAVLSRNRDLR
jgi:hypothetical protein